MLSENLTSFETVKDMVQRTWLWLPELDISPVNLAFDLSLIAFYDFVFVSCLSCLEVCPNESLPKSDDRNMFKFAFEI